MVMLDHRHQLFELLPNWLRNSNAYRVLYSVALMIDGLGDALLAAIKIRFPNLYSSESLSLLSNERRMRSGPTETAESFAARLTQWWDVAKHSGDLYTIAKQMACYFLPRAVRLEIVTNNGTRYTLGIDGSWTVDSVSWDWDGHAEKWSRFWVLLSNEDIQATSTDHRVLDSIATVLQRGRFVGSDVNGAAATLRQIEEDNRAPYNHCDCIIVMLDRAAFWASPPAGNWDYWANRNLSALYWAGT